MSTTIVVWNTLVIGIAADAWWCMLVPVAVMALAPTFIAAGGVLLTRDRSAALRYATTGCVLVSLGNLFVFGVYWWWLFASLEATSFYELILAGWCFQAFVAALSLFVGFAAVEERYTQGEDAED